MLAYLTLFAFRNPGINKPSLSNKALPESPTLEMHEAENIHISDSPCGKSKAFEPIMNEYACEVKSF